MQKDLTLLSGGAQHRVGLQRRAITRCCAPPLTKTLRALFYIFAFTPIAHAGTVMTLDGKNLDGQISFEPDNTLLLIPKTGPKEPIKLSEALRVDPIAEDRRLFRGVLLTTGEAIAADSITRFDADGVRIVRSGGIALDIPSADLAAVYFRPVSPEVQRHIPPGHPGAVLDNGDFFEGDPAGLNGNQVRISSILFGIRSFDVSHQVREVILADAAIPDADEIVHLVDGSILLGKTATVSQERLTIDDARLGSTTVEGRTVAHIQMGGDAFDSLTHLAPPKLDGGPTGYAIDATTAGVPMMLLGIPVVRGIGQQPGISLTWNLSGKYKSLIARAGIPLGIVPLQHLQFVVLANGNEIFRSVPVSSVDDPALIAMSMKNVNTLTLRVEAPDPLAPGATGLWADPILVRDRESANSR